MWTKNTFVFTKDIFPTLHRCSEVIDKIEKEVSPIEVAVEALTARNEDLLHLVSKTYKAGKLKNNFTMTIKGSIDAAINGGTKKYKEAFLNEIFFSNASPGELQFVSQLEQKLEQHIEYLENALQVHKMYCPQNLVNLQNQLLLQFAQLKKDLLTK